MHLADPFEDWEGPIHNYAGEKLSFCRRCGTDRYFSGKKCQCGRRSEPLQMWHVRMRMFRLFDSTPWINWVLVTKYPQNVLGMWPDCEDWDETMDDVAPGFRHNVWLGTSFHNQASADHRLGHLAACQHLSPVVFGEAQPILGPISLNDMWIDWLVIGGENPGARKCDLAWIADLIDQADMARVPAWVTQVGYAIMHGERYRWAKNIGHWPRPVTPPGDDMRQWPETIRRRELPLTGELF